jgi:Zn-dependent M28 family amino/carboxypeptidase
MANKAIWGLSLALILSVILSSCQSSSSGLDAALQSISLEDFSHNVQILSSDEFEGRAPATPGEEKTVTFLRQEFENLGLKPGNGDTFFQEVPMLKMKVDPSAKLRIFKGNSTLEFNYGDDFMAWTLRGVDKVGFTQAEMIFVGYGIIAPEYNWNDYQGLNVKDKIVVILINDPGFETKNPDLFKGKAMTYYGRWTYKFEEAARQGAAGALIIHETAPAAYPWGVVRNSWGGTNYTLETEDNNMSRCAIEGWLTLEAAQKILAAAGLDYQELKKKATKRGFKGFPLNLKASLNLKNNVSRVVSKNVVALYEGGERADEVIIFTSHWDHFGIDPTIKGDNIFNGALDNATGTAGLIELARAFTQLKPKPKRSFLFLAVTGEEQGLLGSQYYATHPVFPLEKTVAVINMDALNIWGPMKDITVIGYGLSELDKYVEEEAAKEKRQVNPDPTPERGSYFRSDHFSFAKQGVPALYLSPGVDHVVHGRKWTLAQRDKYLAENYHKPSDEFDPNWDLSGAIQDLRLIFKIAYRLSQEETFPNWNEGTEFKSLRDKMMGITK